MMEYRPWLHPKFRDRVVEDNTIATTYVDELGNITAQNARPFAFDCRVRMFNDKIFVLTLPSTTRTLWRSINEKPHYFMVAGQLLK